MKKPLCLTDKNGIPLSEDDVVYDGYHYYHIYTSGRLQFEMFSCSNGYIHSIQPGTMQYFERVGTFEECEHLMDCD